MKLYRIYTEKKDNLADICLEYISDFTISDATGYWKASKEQFAIIEIADTTDFNTYAIAETILYRNKQQSVMIVNPDNTILFLENLTKAIKE